MKNGGLRKDRKRKRRTEEVRKQRKQRKGRWRKEVVVVQRK
jgi:hypothetical protein